MSKQKVSVEDALIGMPVGVAWADMTNGKIQFVNDKFTIMFGYQLKDLTTVHDWIETCYAIPEQAKIIDSFWDSQDDPENRVKDTIEQVELDIICKDGSIKTVLSGKIMLPHGGGALSTFLDITPRKAKEDIFKRQALEDPLTGLLNKRAFSQILKQCIKQSLENSTLLALLMLDLDGFKKINDTLGHDQGDKLLQHVAERLKFAVRNDDSLCRIGGDEFAVVLNKIDQKASAEMVADRIIREVSKPYDLHEQTVLMGISIGIVDCSAENADDEILFKLADEALYRAKNSGRGKWSK